MRALVKRQNFIMIMKRTKLETILTSRSKGFTTLKSDTFVLSPNRLGTLGEVIAKRLLQEKGFKVRPFRDLLYKKRPCSKAKLLAEICSQNCSLTQNIFGVEVPKEKYHCKRRLVNIWWKDCIRYLYESCPGVCNRFCRARKIFQIQRENKVLGLDFVAYKDRKEYAVEVKTGTHKELKRSQRELALRLREEFGIEFIQIHIVLQNKLDYQAEAKFG